MRTILWAVAALLAVLIVIGVRTAYVINERLELIDHRIGRLENARMTLTATWVSAGGTTHTVTSNRQPDETSGELIARHNEAVRLMQEIHPPIEG